MLLYFSSRLNDNDYDYVASERLGRTKAYQEQYVFVFRYVFSTSVHYMTMISVLIYQLIFH